MCRDFTINLAGFPVEIPPSASWKKMKRLKGNLEANDPSRLKKFEEAVGEENQAIEKFKEFRIVCCYYAT
jgi:hypothetical protein